MSDLLSAASLLMAVIAILYSLWYPELTKVLEIKPRKYTEDNVAYCVLAKQVFFGKAIPLSLMAFSVALIFLPDAIKLFIASTLYYIEGGVIDMKNYDAVKTAYCFVFLFSLILAIYIWWLTIRVGLLWVKLRK